MDGEAGKFNVQVKKRNDKFNENSCHYKNDKKRDNKTVEIERLERYTYTRTGEIH